jgi:trans-2,3-dihydro-3-hydroxyanthranilate isomerase
VGSFEGPAPDRATASAGVVRAFERRQTDAIGFPSSGAFGMGRPSFIALTLEVEGGALLKATVAGAVVIVSSGALEL